MSNFIAEMQILIRKNEKLQADNKQLKEEIEGLKPKPLLFHKLLGFTIIIDDSVPDNQIWFASKRQLAEALEYSMKQLEQALSGEDRRAGD